MFLISLRHNYTQYLVIIKKHISFIFQLRYFFYFRTTALTQSGIPSAKLIYEILSAIYHGVPLHLYQSINLDKQFEKKQLLSHPTPQYIPYNLLPHLVYQSHTYLLIIASGSGPVPMNFTGTPTASSTYSTYLRASSGRSAYVRAPAVGAFQPGKVSYTTSTLLRTSRSAGNESSVWPLCLQATPTLMVSKLSRMLKKTDYQIF